MKPQYNLFLNNYRMIIKNGPVKLFELLTVSNI